MDQKLIDAVDEILSNDEVSTDDDLVDHFVQMGLSQADALDAVSHRDRMLNFSPTVSNPRYQR
jgi:hypothetical protein